MVWCMKKQKGSEREEDRKRKAPSIPDTGQGAAGNLGSEGDQGKDRVSDNDESNTGEVIPIPIKRKAKADSNS